MSDADDIFADVIDGEGREGGGGRESRDTDLNLDFGDRRSVAAPETSGGGGSETVKRLFKNKWTWIVIGVVGGCVVGVIVGVIWFKIIAKQEEKEKAANGGAVLDVDKINGQKRTAALSSAAAAVIVAGLVILITKLTIKWQ